LHVQSLQVFVSKHSNRACPSEQQDCIYGSFDKPVGERQPFKYHDGGWFYKTLVLNMTIIVIIKTFMATWREHRKSLAKENKRIKEQLAKLWPYLESSFIYDLVNGNIMNERDLRQRASILGINLIPAIVMLIGIEHPGNLDGGISEFKQQLTRQKVFEVILGIFNDNKSILITPIMANKFILLIPCISAAMSTVHYDYCRLKGEAIIKKLTVNCKFNCHPYFGTSDYATISLADLYP
jgi:hypothetical protein